MNLSLETHDHFRPRPGPVVICIADGVGIAPSGPSNAVSEANTPVLDALFDSALCIELKAHGVAVGLPSDDDMGNSEVGHNALGAGRVFAQGAKLVGHALADGSIFEGEVWAKITEQTDTGGTLHLLGLHSDGNVHSHITHLHGLLSQAASQGIGRARIHILLDGRDVGVRSALTYIESTEAHLAELNRRYGVDYRIGSGGGRMTITMDRYGADWAMVKRGYDCHTHGVGRRFRSASEAVETFYSESDTGDQYLDPFVVVDENTAGEESPIGVMCDGDAVVLFNFRGDRAIEISRAYEEADFDGFDRGQHPEVFFAGMLQYDGDTGVPEHYLVDPPVIDRTMSQYLAAEGIRSFAVAETQKFGHVTYFWNGNRSGYIDEALETYVQIDSDNVEFNKTPNMKAVEIADVVVDLISSGEYQFGRFNLANGDMVGHTSDLNATIEAMVAVDAAVGRVMEATAEMGGIFIFTADHGNADVMYKQGANGPSPVTSHTLNKVAFAINDVNYNGEYKLDSSPDAGLANVAATVCNLLGYKPPEGYEPSLVRFG